MQWWVHDLDPVIVELGGGLAIRWYGLAYLAAFALAYLLLRHAWNKGRSPLDPPKLEQLMTWCIAGVLVGGRLGYMLLYDLQAFLSNPFLLFRINEGGMSFHGGAVGVILALVYVSRKQGITMREVGDAVVTAVPIGLFLGRLANFINGELWGKITTKPWAMIFPNAPTDDQEPLVYVQQLGGYANPRHPSQLYEAALEGLLLGLWLNWRYWGKKRPPSGQIAGEFLTGYAILRTIGELFREPDAALVWGLSRGTFYSLLMFVAGVAAILWTRGRVQKER